MKDKTNIVKYHNDLNSITFQKFGHVDFDFFMVLCSRLRDSGETTVKIPFSEFKKLSGYSPKTSEERFISDVKSMNFKQLLSTGMVKKGNKIEQFVLFTKFVIDPDEKIITAKVNEEYKYILNEVTKNFTRFELQEFISLDSKYSKTLYRLLKQYRTTGVYVISLEEFKRLVGVPESYQNKKVMQKIVDPSVKALKPYFNNLSCEVQYEAKRGRPVKGYKFTFTPEKRQKQLQQSSDQKQQTKKKTGNRFHNFEQREYSSEDIQALERMLNKH